MWHACTPTSKIIVRNRIRSDPLLFNLVVLKKELKKEKIQSLTFIIADWLEN